MYKVFIYSVLTVLYCINVSLGADGARKTGVWLENDEIELGLIAPDQDSIKITTRIFTDKKTGVNITNVIATCSCSTPSLSSKRVTPGNPIIISSEAALNTRSSNVSGVIYFETDEPEHPFLRLKFTGDINETSNRLMSIPPFVNIGDISQGEMRSFVIEIRRMDNSFIGDLTDVVLPGDNCIAIIALPDKSSNTENTYLVTYKSSFMNHGPWRGEIKFIDPMKSEDVSYSLPILANIVPPIQLQPTFIPIKNGNIVKCFLFKTRGNRAPFKLLRMTTVQDGKIDLKWTENKKGQYTAVSFEITPLAPLVINKRIPVTAMFSNGTDEIVEEIMLVVDE